NFDTNTWYQLTETRVDFSVSLQYQAPDKLVMATACSNCNQYWQVIPSTFGSDEPNNGSFVLRNRATGVTSQLGVCYDESESDSSRTRPCMLDGGGGNLAGPFTKWDITNWASDGTQKLVNVGNGTDYHLDCHPGNPMFMSSTTAPNPKQPAQHWQFSSIGVINDVTYSTGIPAVSVTPCCAHVSLATDSITGPRRLINLLTLRGLFSRPVVARSLRRRSRGHRRRCRRHRPDRHSPRPLLLLPPAPAPASCCHTPHPQPTSISRRPPRGACQRRGPVVRHKVRRGAGPRTLRDGRHAHGRAAIGRLDRVAAGERRARGARVEESGLSFSHALCIITYHSVSQHSVWSRTDEAGVHRAPLAGLAVSVV
ncbi:MAG: hypothetical protein INR71_16235, partial [Terriglobus roseus]|nr:hypothetical protein [Terriglobus roseus]